MAKARQKTFKVEAVIKVLMEVGIKADTLAGALALSETLTRDDYMTLDGNDVIDGSFRVTGVRDAESFGEIE